MHSLLFVCREYRAGLRKLGSFSTVESFWKHYLYMKRPSHLENNVNLYLFRDGPNMAPMWEVKSAIDELSALRRTLRSLVLGMLLLLLLP